MLFVDGIPNMPDLEVDEIRLDRDANGAIILRKGRERIDGSTLLTRVSFHSGMKRLLRKLLSSEEEERPELHVTRLNDLEGPAPGSFTELGNFINADRVSLINVADDFQNRCEAILEIFRAFPDSRINVVIHKHETRKKAHKYLWEVQEFHCQRLDSDEQARAFERKDHARRNDEKYAAEQRAIKLFTPYYLNTERDFGNDDLVIFWDTKEILYRQNSIFLSNSYAKFRIVGFSSQTDLWNNLSLGCQQLNIFGDRVFKLRSKRRYLPEMQVELKRFEIAVRQKRIRTTSDFRSEIWANEPRNQFIVSIVEQLVEELAPPTGKQRRIAIVTDSIPHMKRLLGIIPNATLDESQMHLAEELEFVRPLIVGWSLPDPVRPFVVLSQDLHRVSHFRNGAIVWAAGGRSVAELPNSWLLHQSGEPVEMRIIDITDTHEGQFTRESFGRIAAYFRHGLGVGEGDYSRYRRGLAAWYMTGVQQ